MHQSYWGASWMLVLSLHVAATLGVLAGCFAVAYPEGNNGSTLAVYAGCFALIGIVHVWAHNNSTFIGKYALRDDHDFRWFEFSVRNIALGVIVGAVALGVAWLGGGRVFCARPQAPPGLAFARATHSQRFSGRYRGPGTSFLKERRRMRSIPDLSPSTPRGESIHATLPTKKWRTFEENTPLFAGKSPDFSKNPPIS